MTDTITAEPTEPTGPAAPPSPSPGGAPSARPAAAVVRAGVVTLVVAVACTVLVEVLQRTASPVRVDFLLLRAPGVFALCVLVLWVPLLGLVAVVGRLWPATAVFVVVLVAVGIAEHIKLDWRSEPVYPSDVAFVGQPGFLVEMVPRDRLVLLLAMLLAVGVGLVLAGRLLARRYPPLRRRDDPAGWRRLLGTRVAVVACCVAVLWYAEGFNAPGNALRGAFDAAGADWRPWSPGVNYVRNGFVGGTLFNMPVPAMAPPQGYSAATMRRLAARYQALAARDNHSRTAGDLDDVNVVVVLSESFSDPTRLRGVSVPQDPIPFTRSLTARTTSGQMLAQQVGGGTANVEFEALTGMSDSQFAPQLTTPYQMLVPHHPGFPSAVRYFRAHGHRAIAVHPFIPSMYRRDASYRAFGMDRFIDRSQLHETTRLGHDRYIADSAAFHEVERQLRDSRTPLFVNLVTMQNHGPYQGEYDDPLPVRGIGGPSAEQARNYLRGLRHSDDALGHFLTTLEDSGEKTLVVFYGDHLPGFWSQRVRDDNPRRIKETPYFIWSSFGGHVRHTSTVSPPYFLPQAFDMVGARIPPYYALLGRLERQLPGMDPGFYIDARDRTIRPDQLTARARAVLHDYRLVQYDLSVGRRYSLRAMLDLGEPFD